MTELYTYTYDHAGRPTETRHKLDGNPEQLLAKLSYDELGRVQNRKAGNTSVVNTTYGYNVRSWTSSIAGTNFNETLGYNYDGNIKQQVFGDNSSYSVTYNFVYDDLSRLTDATSDEGSYIGSYDCHYAYDKQGNATSIVTNGTKWVTNRKTMLPALKDVNYDNLTLAYNGNQLKNVSDAGDVGSSSITEQFNDYADSTQEYTYNANGAMTKDLNKGISSIQYNLLNLPQQIDILSPVGEARNTYSYAADGTKLQVIKKYNSNFNTSPIIGSAVNASALDVTKTTDYVGNKLFENNTLDRILVDGGYIKNGIYYFYETDHLGDNRTVINQSGTVVERNDYYPYGMQMGHNDPNQGDLVRIGDEPNAFKFSGKELDVMGGLNLYDSQARWYDPCIPILPTVDPKCEKYYSISPYVYCADNPLRFVDPTGQDTLHVNPDGSPQRFPNGDVVSHPGGENAAIQDKPLLTDDDGTPQLEIVGKRIAPKGNGVVAVGISGTMEAGAGGNVSGTPVNYVHIYKGKDTGANILMSSGDLGGGSNIGIGASANLTMYTYTGDINNLTRDNFAGSSDVTNLSAGELITGGVSQSISKPDQFGGVLKGSSLTIGIGASVLPLNATMMKSNTKLYRQFDKK